MRFVASDVSSREDTTRALEHVDHLQLLLDVTRLINSTLAINEVLEYVIDAVIQVTRAERGFLMTIGPSGDLEFRGGRDFDRTDLETEGVAVSQSTIERVRRSGEPVVVSDTFGPDVAGPQSVMDLGLRSVMCVP